MNHGLGLYLDGMGVFEAFMSTHGETLPFLKENCTYFVRVVCCLVSFRFRFFHRTVEAEDWLYFHSALGFR